MNSLIILNNNTDFMIKLINHLAIKCPNVYIAGIVSNLSELLSSIYNIKPKIIILNFKFSKYDFAQLINAIKKISNYKPHIIMLKKNIIKNNLYCCKDYKIVFALCDLESVSNTILRIFNSNDTIYAKQYVIYELAKLNFNISSIGTKYLIDCIVLAQKHPDWLQNLEKKLYPQIAILNSTTSQHVKWNINKSIDSMFRYANDSFLMDYFVFYEKRKPTAKILISTVLNKYEHRYFPKK